MMRSRSPVRGEAWLLLGVLGFSSACTWSAVEKPPAEEEATFSFCVIDQPSGPIFEVQGTHDRFGLRKDQELRVLLEELDRNTPLAPLAQVLLCDARRGLDYGSGPWVRYRGMPLRGTCPTPIRLTDDEAAELAHAWRFGAAPPCATERP